jgi:two-component system response regulator DevR
MIRVAIVDDHHAIRLGLQAAIRSEPGLVPAGVASEGAGADAMLYRTRPDVLLLDYQLPDVDGLTLCRRIKSNPPAPAVILYSAFADAAMTVPAIVAGCDGIVHKGQPARELFEAIRTVARGGDATPPISPWLSEAARQMVEPQDLALLAMLIDRTPPAAIASTLGIDRETLRRRVDGMLRRLKAPVPVA